MVRECDFIVFIVVLSLAKFNCSQIQQPFTISPLSTTQWNRYNRITHCGNHLPINATLALLPSFFTHRLIHNLMHGALEGDHSTEVALYTPVKFNRKPSPVSKAILSIHRRVRPHGLRMRLPGQATVR